MRRKVLINSPIDFHYFSDIDDDDSLFCITHDVYDDLLPFLEAYNYETKDAPPTRTVKAYKFDLVKKNDDFISFNIIDNQLIDFKVNRINWVNKNAIII